MIELIIVILVIAVIAYKILHLKRIVSPKFADIVTRSTGVEIYSGDKTVSNKTTYYAFPEWFPVFGVNVKRTPREIIEIPVQNYETFAKGNPRFVVDVSVYCRITDVLLAAKRFTGDTVEDFKCGIKEIIVAAIRKTTTNFTIEDVITKKKEIEDMIASEIKDDFEKWGVELSNVAVVDIRDPVEVDASGKKHYKSTVVQDIAAKKESEINSLSRQEIANMQRQAEIVEAARREEAETKKIAANESIAKRDQDMRQNVAIAEKMAVAKEMDVKREREVTSANIEAEARVKIAEGEKRAAIERAEGERKKLELEGNGKASATKAIGEAEADVVKATKFAEAEGLFKLAEAQEKQQEKAIDVLKIQKEQIVGVALAEALQQANIQYYGGGKPRDFMDLFSAEGGISTGASINGILKVIQDNNPDFNIGDIIDVLKKNPEKKNPEKKEENGLTTEQLMKMVNEFASKKNIGM